MTGVTDDGVGRPSASATDGELDTPLTDEELTALALAADPHAPIGENAIPMSVHLAQFGTPLPLWYMPPAVALAGAGHRWRVPFVAAIVGAFLLIEALGLCNTYGILSLG
jgi:hypothetical protein